MFAKIRGFVRLFYFAFRTFLEIVLISVVSKIRGFDMHYALQRRRRYCRHLFPLMGIRAHISGTPPDFPCILMGNHRCYLDPAIVIMDVLGFPVSKAEVEKWPLIGYGAKLTGVHYLKRDSVESRRDILSSILDTIKLGFPIILFPEGTTGGQDLTMPLRPGGFKLAAQNGIPIVPIAIEYGSPKDYWFGSSTFIPHFIDRFGQKEMHIWLHYGEPILSDNYEVLMEKTLQFIHREIPAMRLERAALLNIKA